MKWLFWTGCRLNEAVGMRWDEISGDTWTVPAARSKNGRQRVIPLPRQATTFLRNCELAEAEALVFPSARGGVLSNWDKVTKRVHVASSTKGWHRHDVRRTVATLLGDLGVPPHVISVVLGHAHVAAGATAVYARSRYQREHREALQILADEIEQIISGETKILRFAV
jgi:integrase